MMIHNISCAKLRQQHKVADGAILHEITLRGTLRKPQSGTPRHSVGKAKAEWPTLQYMPAVLSCQRAD